MWRKIFVSGLAAIGMAGAAAAQALVPLPPQPEGLAWPTQEWETGEIPEETVARGRGGHCDAPDRHGDCRREE